jgi:nucleoside-diphosphate-sugar epimerase
MIALVTGGSGFIGTNLVGLLRAQGDRVVSVDVRPPQDPAHIESFESLDVLDRVAIAEVIARVTPNIVYHLAARTDLDGATVAGYRANVEGTQNLVDALNAAGFSGRLVMVSSMLVCRNGYVPAHSTDYQPDSPYGESKVAAEQVVRSSALDWVICRPTSIWGPWFAAPYRDFFDSVRTGRYVHPGRHDVVKAFGFVGNVTRQLVSAASEAASGSTHYLSDPHEYSIRSFADQIAVVNGRRVRTVPVALLRLAGLGGDVAKRLGLMTAPPLTSFRLRNMLTSTRFDTTEIDELVTRRFGHERIDLEAAVTETTRWLDEQEGR